MQVSVLIHLQLAGIFFNKHGLPINKDRHKHNTYISYVRPKLVLCQHLYINLQRTVLNLEKNCLPTPYCPYMFQKEAIRPEKSNWKKFNTNDLKRPLNPALLQPGMRNKNEMQSMPSEKEQVKDLTLGSQIGDIDLKTRQRGNAGSRERGTPRRVRFLIAVLFTFKSEIK